MIDKLKKLLRNEPDLDAIRKQYATIYGLVEEMELSFSKGGPVTYEQLSTYKISTPDQPIGYPTGKNCMSFRLPDLPDGSLHFYTLCVAPPGEVGRFGWHWHPKSYERCVQLVGTAKHDGKDLPPFSVVEFAPGTRHDYQLPPGGSVLTSFTKVIA